MNEIEETEAPPEAIEIPHHECPHCGGDQFSARPHPTGAVGGPRFNDKPLTDEQIAKATRVRCMGCQVEQHPEDLHGERRAHLVNELHKPE
jgi:hypothetical protein